ncbi:hypothetical protein JTE90_019255 [Oedothorax gibbosus]|uniref:Uncharacterized protein n=1 Tax=Oedothorax gibbosus TaxID=931172 RepID=A0AAV6US13_9ARAC|nr:hypothetical protein JTE90_019255 [Oedothorax gibbosus]
MPLDKRDADFIALETPKISYDILSRSSKGGGSPVQNLKKNVEGPHFPPLRWLLRRKSGVNKERLLQGSAQDGEGRRGEDGTH